MPSISNIFRCQFELQISSEADVGYCDPTGLSPQLPHTIDPRSQRLCVDSCGGQAGNGRELSKQGITQPPSRFRTVIGLIRSLVLALAFKNVAQNLIVEYGIMRHYVVDAQIPSAKLQKLEKTILPRSDLLIRRVCSAFEGL